MKEFVTKKLVQFSSVQFSRSVVSDSLRPHEPQHARPPYPSPTPGVYPNSCPLSRWCHPTILSFDVPFSSCRQSFSASGSFLIIRLCASGGQSIGASVQHQSFNEYSGLIFAWNLSPHQGLFQRVISLHPVAKVLEFQLQRQSFQWIFRTDFL